MLKLFTVINHKEFSRSVSVIAVTAAMTSIPLVGYPAHVQAQDSRAQRSNPLPTIELNLNVLDRLDSGRADPFAPSAPAVPIGKEEEDKTTNLAPKKTVKIKDTDKKAEQDVKPVTPSSGTKFLTLPSPDNKGYEVKEPIIAPKKQEKKKTVKKPAKEEVKPVIVTKPAPDVEVKKTVEDIKKPEVKSDIKQEKKPEVQPELVIPPALNIQKPEAEILQHEKIAVPQPPSIPQPPVENPDEKVEDTLIPAPPVFKTMPVEAEVPVVPEIDKKPDAMPVPPLAAEPVIPEKQPALITPMPMPPTPEDEIAKALNEPVAKSEDSKESKPVERSSEIKNSVAEKPALTIGFISTETRLPLAEEEALKKLAERIKASGERITLVAYASEAIDQSTTAKRVALSRGLAVRGYLIDAGVNKMNVNLRVEGSKNAGDMPDRVDIFTGELN